MKTRPTPLPTLGKLLMFALAIFIARSSSAQNSVLKVFEEWKTTAATQNSFQRSVVRSKAFSGTTYYYLTGATVNANGRYEVLTQKMNASGTVLWSQTYSGTGAGNSVGTDIQIDAVGNVYVCGTTHKDATDSSNAIILKYNTAGTFKWVYSYNGPGSRNDGFGALALGANGNVVIAAGSAWGGSTTKYDFLQARCDSSGNNVWATTWDYLNLNDGAHNIYTRTNKLYVAGGAQSATTTYKYAILEVTASNGSVANSTVSGGTGFGIDQLTDVQADASGNIYVTGGVFNGLSTLYDYKTIKLDTALTQLWTATYNGPDSLDDIATGLCIDQAGNVIVTGYTNTAAQGRNYTTIKYNSAGTQMWATSYNGSGNGHDSATCIVVNQNDSNKIYVSGFSYNGTTKDYYTIRYNAAGNLKWGINFNSIYNKDDRATSIALDTLGNVIVTGQNHRIGGEFLYTTVKYVEKNITILPDTAQANPNYLFVENRDQVINTNEQAANGVRYYNAFTSVPWTYFTDTTVSHVFAKTDTSSATTDTLIRVDLRYNSQNSGRVYAMDESFTYYNFFLPQVMPYGRGRCQAYKQLIFPELYNGLDAVYGSNIMGLKMYYIGKPGTGGNPVSQVVMNWQGADSVRVLGNGSLRVYTKLGNLTLPRPSAYQINSSGQFVSLSWQPTYNIVSPGVVQFSSFGAYNSAQHLVIAMDWGYAAWALPAVYNNLWSTFIQGSSNADQGRGIAINQTSNHKFFTGATNSGDFPATPGNFFDPTFNGSEDAFCMRFNAQDSLVWATFMGGYGSDIGIDIKLDASNNAVMAGYSFSDDFPIITPTGAYKDAYNVIVDLTYFIFKLQPSGQNGIWSTYFGGREDEWSDWGAHLDISSTGRIYLAGKTRSLAAADSFPLRQYNTGYYQNTAGGGEEGFVARFNAQHQLEWSTFFGSSSLDEVSSMDIDGKDNVYLAGITFAGSFNTSCAASTNGNFPLCNSGGYFQSAAQGLGDAYIARFDSSCVLRWSTLFGGSGQETYPNVLAGGGGSYLVGSTGSTNGANPITCLAPVSGEFPVCDPGGGATFNQNSAGGGDLFIARFNQNDTLIWSTFYGGTNVDVPKNLAIDQAANLYIGGRTRDDYPTAQPNANFFLQTNNADAGGTTYDPFFMQINPSNVVTWATHYGGYTSGAAGIFPEAVMCLSTFQDDKLYIGGVAQSLNFPYRCAAPQYCFQTMNSNHFTDAFIAELDLNGLVGIAPYFQPQTLDFVVYPSPVSDQLTVELGGQDLKEATLNIYNTLGQIVYYNVPHS